MSIDAIRITYELETAGRDASSIPVIIFTWRTEMKNFFGQSRFSVCCGNKQIKAFLLFIPGFVVIIIYNANKINRPKEF
jgi:hypothetical protein